MLTAKKIVTGYFVFTMIVGGMVVFGQTDLGKHYYADVFQTMNWDLDAGLKAMEKEVPTDLFAPETEKEFIDGKKNYGLVNVDFDNKPAEAFVFAGEKGKEMMELQLKAHDKAIELKSLKLKLAGLDAKNLLGARLVAEGETLVEAEIKGEYVDFGQFQFMLEPYMAAAISIEVDLGPGARSGKRFRLDLESAEDIDLRVGARRYLLRGFYPMEGKYLTVVKKGV